MKGFLTLRLDSLMFHRLVKQKFNLKRCMRHGIKEATKPRVGGSRRPRIHEDYPTSWPGAPDKPCGENVRMLT